MRARVAAIVLVAAVWWVAPADADQPPQVYVSADPAEAQPAQVITFTGSRCLFNGHGTDAAVLYIFPKPSTSSSFDQLAEIPVAADGTWRGEVVLGSGATPGDYEVSLSCRDEDQMFGPEGQDQDARTTLRVVAGQVPTLAQTPAKAEPSQPLSGSVGGCRSGDTIELRLRPKGSTSVIATGGATAAGSAPTAVTLTVPSSAAGDHVLQARCSGGGRTLATADVPIEVRAAMRPNASNTTLAPTTSTTTAGIDATATSIVDETSTTTTTVDGDRDGRDDAESADAGRTDRSGGDGAGPLLGLGTAALLVAASAGIAISRSRRTPAADEAGG